MGDFYVGRDKFWLYAGLNYNLFKDKEIGMARCENSINGNCNHESCPHFFNHDFESCQIYKYCKVNGDYTRCVIF